VLNVNVLDPVESKDMLYISKNNDAAVNAQQY
jgi:hypothetical protein